MFININHIHSKFTSKYKTTPSYYNTLQINNLLKPRRCKISTFTKESTISSSFEDYFKRYYTSSEIKDRIPKFINYYKNYLLFFCKPTFRNSIFNTIIQHHGEKKAEIYYNKKYKTKKQQHSTNTNNNGKIFTDTIKVNINKISIFYQNPDISKETIKLNDDNEFNTISNHSLIKENSLLSILNAFDTNITKINNNKQSKTITVEYNKTHSHVMPTKSNTFMLKSKRMNTIQNRKSNLKLMSPVCLIKSQMNCIKHEMKFPLLHMRMKTDSQNIKMNSYHKMKNNYHGNMNSKKVFLLSASRNKFYKKQGISSFNQFDIQQNLLNGNRKGLIRGEMRSRNEDVKVELGRMFRTINGGFHKGGMKSGCEKKSLYGKGNGKEGTYEGIRNKGKGDNESNVLGSRLLCRNNKI